MSDRTYRFGEFTLSTLARELRRGDVPVALSPRAFDCLVHLIEHRDRAVGKDELVTAIWGRPNVSDTQLGQAVLRARRAIGDDGHVQQFIRTVSRYGYRWVGSAAIVGAAGDPASSVADRAPDAAPARPAETRPATVPRHAIAPPPAATRRTPRKVQVALAALVATGLFAGVLALRHRDRSAPAAAPSAVQAGAAAIVLPLRVEADRGSAWLRLGAMDLVAGRLRSGGLAVPPSENTVALLHAGGSGDAAAAAAALREATPGALLVRGDLRRTGGQWTAALQAATADGASVQVDATQDTALEAARAAADRLLARLGRARPPAPPPAAVQDRLQRAQAAMLANDLDDARAILIGDPQLAREEPQLGYRLAQVDFRSGDYARGEAALSALLAEPAANDPLFRARLLNARGGMRIRQDNYTGAAADYDAAVSLLQAGGHAPELGLALTGRGVVHAMHHEFAPALADLGAARVQLQAAGDALAVARVDSNLGGLEMSRDRPEQALAYLDGAAARFERYGAINELMETLTSLVSDNLALLRPADALAASDRSWTLAPRVTDPNQRLELALDRVDVFLALGRLREAGTLLGSLPDAAPQSDPFIARRLPALRARLAYAEGRLAEAATYARAALDLRAPTDDTGEGVAEIALLRQRAMLAGSRRPASAEVLAPPAAEAPAWPVQAVLAAEWADAHGDPAAAAAHYRVALDLAERRGVPADVALVAASYGPWLLQRGRLQEASAVIGRVSPWANRDFDCALLQVRLFQALHDTQAWRQALVQATSLAGERRVAAELRPHG